MISLKVGKCDLCSSTPSWEICMLKSCYDQVTNICQELSHFEKLFKKMVNARHGKLPDKRRKTESW